MIAALLALAFAAEPAWDTLLDDAGWGKAATPQTPETGQIDLRTKVIDGVTCLRGEALVEPEPAVLIGVAADIDGSPRFSSEKLLLAQTVARSGERQDYVQVLDVPNWTMASDRFWVLRGEARTDGTARSFRWDRFDWRTVHPELAARIEADFPGAVEPSTNWGAWVARPVEGGTLLRYHLCTVPGGSVPDWLQKTAATKTLPGSMADIVREAARRAANPR